VTICWQIIAEKLQENVFPYFRHYLHLFKMAMKQATRTNQAISLKGSTKVGISPFRNLELRSLGDETATFSCSSSEELKEADLEPSNSFAGLMIDRHRVLRILCQQASRSALHPQPTG
jgi:hypothetical protein